MADTILQFNDPLTGSDGKSYVARVCGRPAADGRWEGWIEFVPADGSPVLRSQRETGQSERDDLEYWATGLSRVYLEGSLERTLAPPRIFEPVPTPEPAFDGPAPHPPRIAHTPDTRAVLDPFSIYVKGEDLLRQELSALSVWHLKNISRAYRLLNLHEPEMDRLPQIELIERIVAAVRTISERATQAR
jgi:hypothetical protein